MKKEEIVKFIFEYQPIDKQVEIINFYGFEFPGFNTKSIPISAYKKMHKIFINNLTSMNNLKILDKKIRQLKRNSGENFHSYMSSESIVNKYEFSFTQLISILDDDNYQSKSLEIIELMRNNYDKSEEILNNEKFKIGKEITNDETIKKLRQIITELEKDIKQKEEIINKLNKEKQFTSNKIRDLNGRIIKFEQSLRIEKEKTENHINNINEQQAFIEEIQYKNEQFKIENIQLKNALTSKIHILGLPSSFHDKRKNFIYYYKTNEFNKFLKEFENKSNDYFYYYEPGISYSDKRILNQKSKVLKITNRHQLLTILKEVD